MNIIVKMHDRARVIETTRMDLHSGIMLEDEGVISTAHIGIGTSITLGGVVKAPTHYDLLMWNPRIEVDGRVIVDGDKVNL